MNIYEQHVMEHYKKPRKAGTVRDPDISFHDTNPLCGDTVTITLQIDNTGKILQARHVSRGCAISQAATSMLFENVEGKNVKDVLLMEKEVILEEFGTALSVSRLKCALLGLTALKKAVVEKEHKA